MRHIIEMRYHASIVSQLLQLFMIQVTDITHRSHDDSHSGKLAIRVISRIIFVVTVIEKRNDLISLDVRQFPGTARALFNPGSFAVKAIHTSYVCHRR